MSAPDGALHHADPYRGEPDGTVVAHTPDGGPIGEARSRLVCVMPEAPGDRVAL